MAAFDKNAQITVKNETYSVNDLAIKISKVPSEAIISVFDQVRINFPRRLRMGILRSLLRPYVEQTKKEKEKIADEFSYRLSQFENFTDTQLVNLLEIYKNEGLVQDYYYNLWINILTQLVKIGIGENDFQRLIDLADTNDSVRLEDSKQFNDNFNHVFYDEKGEIDGLTPEQFRPVTYKSTTLGELRSIGDKYDASVPKRLRKKELLEIILKELKDRGEYNEALDDKLSKMSILVLERYAKDHKIKVSTELRKEEIIEYILSNAKETRETYYVPSSSAVYETEQEEVAVDEDIILEVSAKEILEVVFSGLMTVEVEKGTFLDEPATKELDGFEFDGWYKDRAFSEPFNFIKDAVLESMTLYPKYSEKEEENFTVSFKNIKDEIYKQFNIAKNSYLDKPELEVDDDVKFLGWYKDKAFTMPWDFKNDVVTSNVSLYARIESNRTEVAVVNSELPVKKEEVIVTNTVIDDASVAKILEELRIIKAEVAKNNRSKKDALIKQLLEDEADDLTAEKVSEQEEKIETQKDKDLIIISKEVGTANPKKYIVKKRRNFFVTLLKDLLVTALTLLIAAIIILLVTGFMEAYDPNNELVKDVNKVYNYIKIGQTGLASHITSFATWLKNIFS